MGTGLNDFRHNITDMDQEQKKLTITMDSPKGLLYGATVEAMRASEGMGAIPNIAFSDYEKKVVDLVQDSTDGEGKGHMTLPIKDEQNNKIGSLKINLTAVAKAGGPREQDPNIYKSFSVKADTSGNAFYGGLFPKSIASNSSASTQLNKFDGVVTDWELRELVKRHPLAKDWSLTTTIVNNWATVINFQEDSNMFKHGITAASYVLGIDAGQKLEATFDSPVTATTKWSAPLNVAVTYN
ncbi:TPA: hypothetical protein U5E30_004110 [Yersinia enterocolitica]|nr:hypothetical protein [Yersinia enterocolitica]